LNGRLFLRAGVRQGCTTLLEAQATYPLQVLRPHAVPNAGGLALVVLLLSGGLLDGDAASIEVVVEPGARLALRTQAATQVHAGRSCQALRGTVGAAAWFSYLPQAVVPHAAADFLSQTTVDMHATSHVLLSDTLSPGRVHSGEQFAYRRVRSELDVWRDGLLLARERALVEPDPALRTALFGQFSHVSSAYVFGPARPPCLEAGPNTRVGSSELARGGWYIRALADRASTLDELFGQLQAQWWQ
jgi:urease accessory protein